MTRRQFSTLSIAVIALMVAALPGFAQAKGDESRRYATSSLAQTSSEPAVFFKTEQFAAAQPRLGAVEIGRENGRAIARPDAMLAMPTATFKSLDQLSADQNEVFFRQQLKAYDNSLNVPGKKSRIDGDREPAQGKKRIEFVPSRGPGELQR
jgi:hypothetical protein